MESSMVKDHSVDIESGEIAMIDEQEVTRQYSSSNGQGRRVLNRVWSSFISIDGMVREEETVKCAHSYLNYSKIPITDTDIIAERKMFEVEKEGSIAGKKVDVEKPKTKSCRKPPRPPRPPKSPPMNAADQKLMRELSELAMLKRARIDQMKKKLKDTKSTSRSNLCALFITIIFCLVIVWQGFSSRGNSNTSFHGPESSLPHKRRINKNSA